MAKENTSDDAKAPEGTPPVDELVTTIAAREGAYSKVRRPFSKLATELEPKDLAAEGVQKMILAEISRLETEVARHQEFEESFHSKDKECAVLRARRQKSTMLEILYSAGLGIGAALVGLVPSITITSAQVTISIFAVVLILASILAKWVGERHES